MRRLFGGEIDRPLLPILAVTLSGSIAGSMLWTFVGVWAIKHLGASDVQLAFGFLGGAISAAIGGYLGGYLSDRHGRRPLILIGWAIGPLVPLAALAAGTHLWWGIGALVSIGLVGNIGQAANQALVPDLLPRERHEAGYATVRVVQIGGRGAHDRGLPARASRSSGDRVQRLVRRRTRAVENVPVQLRVTARTAHVPAALKLSTAILLMGLPFLALTQSRCAADRGRRDLRVS